jgi:hypothetical protein
VLRGAQCKQLRVVIFDVLAGAAVVGVVAIAWVPAFELAGNSAWYFVSPNCEPFTLFPTALSLLKFLSLLVLKINFFIFRLNNLFLTSWLAC